MNSPEEKFASLYEAYEPEIYAYCRRRFSADLVEDVVADVFLTVWRRIDDAPEGTDGLKWIFRIAYLTTSSRWRSLNRKQNLASKLQGLGVVPKISVVDHVVVRDEVRRALEVLESLPTMDREIIKLATWEGLGAKDIGMVLGITPAAASARSRSRMSGSETRVWA